MKKLFSFLAAAACFIGMSAVEVTFDAGTDKGNAGSTASAFSVEKDGVTIAVSNGLIGTYNNVDHYRIYKSQTLTITSTAGNITKVELACTASGTAQYGPGCMTAPTGVGTYSYDGANGTWTGDVASLVLTASTNQVRATTIKVTTSGQATSIAAPGFSPVAGTYYETQHVTLTATEGATIYYTTDGSTPTTASAVYSAPIEVASSLTIKAFATKDNLTSDVASAAYVIEAPQEVANIAAFKALEDGTMAKITGKLNVFYAYSSNCFVVDESGYMCIYGALGSKYKTGDVIPAGFGGKKGTYQGMNQMVVPFIGVNDPTETAVVSPDEKTLSQITTNDAWEYVVIRNVTINGKNAGNKNFTITDATGTKDGYNGYAAASLMNGIDTLGTTTYHMTGIVVLRNENIQIEPISFEPTTFTQVNNIAELVAADAQVQIANPVTVVAQSGQYLYIKDNSAWMLVYGNVGREYKNGDQITGIAGKITTYNGLTEIIPVASTFGAPTAGTPVEPEEVGLEDLSTDMMHQYVYIPDATLAAIEGDARNFTISNETGESILRLNGFDVVAPTDFTKTYNVTGFVAYYKTKTADQIQIYPTAIEEVGGGIKGDVNGDGEVTVGDVSAIYDIMLGLSENYKDRADVNGDGEITVGDVSAVYDIMLGLD